ncbi:hypothetical protein HNQ64_001846 [Prosthecobacter dejongeii]|uniref:Uncharacterized protein n=1 Tax=Prosthecobacter dejongeii TaxID=48465 RepID=A0A7W7YK83_9BACT|nr:hypothetical protein [Prosthecobacter dejongeii]
MRRDEAVVVALAFKLPSSEGILELRQPPLSGVT